MKRLIPAVALLLAFAGADAMASPKTVMVGGYTMGTGDYYGGGTDTPLYQFNPSNVTINVGDTVTFTNVGGINVAHNVETDANQIQSFRCANGCDGDGMGGNGTPAFNEWSSTVTFTKAGVIHYHCYNHQNMGMVGTITVNAVAAAQNIVSGLSGNWDDPTPNQGGHGFQFEILPNNGMLAIWFVFNPTGTGQTWIYSQGGYDPNSNDVVLPAYLETGGTFPPNFDGSKLTVTPWGNLEFKFTDCSHGTAQFTPNATADAAGYHIVAPFPIQQLTKIPGTACP